MRCYRERQLKDPDDLLPSSIGTVNPVLDLRERDSCPVSVRALTGSAGAPPDDRRYPMDVMRCYWERQLKDPEEMKKLRGGDPLPSSIRSVNPVRDPN